MDKRVGVVDVNRKAGLVNLDTTIPGTDVTAIELSRVPDVMPGDVLQVTVEDGKLTNVQQIFGMKCSTTVNSA